MSNTVLVLGGGPAGCAAALTLRRYLPHVPVCLLTRAASPARAVGETLAPGVLPLLDYIGLRVPFQQAGHLPCGATASSWGASVVQERSYLFSGRGQGWHLDRSRFDAWLLGCAQQAGVHVICARATRAHYADSAWQVGVDGGNTACLQARAIIDASGRTAWLQRRAQVKPQRDDTLVAEAHWYHRDEETAAFDGALVESAPDGWWYSASLPDHHGVAMFMTDHDLRAQAAWDARLAAAPATRARLAAWRAEGPALVRAANSQCAAQAVGAGWVAAGDAAAAFDPLSALGIGFSLRSGMEAARVAVGVLDGDPAPAADYAASLARIYADYRTRLDGIYALERRWADQPFWARRHALLSRHTPQATAAT